MGWARKIVHPKIGLQTLMIALIVFVYFNLVFCQENLPDFYNYCSWLLYLSIIFLAVVLQQGFEQGECKTDTTKLKVLIGLSCLPIIGRLFNSSEIGIDVFWFKAGQIIMHIIMIGVLIAFIAQDYPKCEDEQVHAIESIAHSKATLPLAYATGYVLCGIILFWSGYNVYHINSTIDMYPFQIRTVIGFFITYVVFVTLIGLSYTDLNNERQECGDKRFEETLIIACVGIFPFVLWFIGPFFTWLEHWWDRNAIFPWTMLLHLLILPMAMAWLHDIVTNPKKCKKSNEEKPKEEIQ